MGDQWVAFLRTDRLSFEQRFRPVGYGTSLDHVFNFGWDDESGAWSLFRQSLTGDFENRLVFAHDVLDLELVDTMGAHDRVVSVAYLEDHPRRAIIDSRVAEVYRYVAELLPDFDIEILDESWDQNRYLARARAPGFAGELVLVDMESQTVQAIAPEYDHLTGFPLARTRLLEIEGADGGRFAANLTLPQNFAEAPVPAVIMPRARPSHADIADPHYLVQYLAASGYAVLRVQNRVDAEFGTGWSPERAVVGWRQTASDIRAAADYLVENGVAAEGRFCGAGKDYAAYAALITAVEDTDLFRCVIGIGPLTDPRLTPGAEIILGYSVDSSDNVLDEASPIQRANEMEAAVLLFHGEADPELDMADHAVTLTNVLDRVDRKVQFIEYPLANHEIRRAPYRVDMLTRIGQFLDQQIGPSPAAIGINVVAAGEAEDPGTSSP